MARESRRPDATPTGRAPSAEPAASIARRAIARTPGSQARGPQQRMMPGLSASGRKPVPLAATPHGRAALRTIDSRRAAILTPHRARRKSVREVRDSPRDFLLTLGRVLARNTQVITTSSSSPSEEGAREASAADNDTSLGSIQAGGGGGDDDDDLDEELPKRPRLSLAVHEDDEDDSDDLQPHRSVILDDENFTMQSIEMPRRAISEQPGGRFSMGSTRMSDYFNTHDMLHSEDIGVDSGFFPPPAVLEEDNLTMGVGDLASPERLDSDGARRDIGRVSDFGIEIPVNDINESTFVMEPQVQDSPDRPPPDHDEPGYDGFAPLVDQRSDDYDDDDLGPMPAFEEEPVEGGGEELPDETEADAATAKRTEGHGLKKKSRKVSKYGIEYPSLPPAVVRRLAQSFAKSSGAKGKITPDAMKAVMQASDWFFEQMAEDLQAYAKHAGRKTIDESDVLTLMKRQRQINPQTTPFALAQRHLPRELLQELRMAPSAAPKKRRKVKGGAEDQDVT